MDLKGKVCIVTGGGAGIGASISQLIASEGGKVSICDIDPKSGEELAKSLNDKYGKTTAVFCKCDVSDSKVFRECFQKTKEAFGQIHVVINNAGIWNDSADSWSREIDINFKGVVNGCCLAFEFMGTSKGGPGGTVVNTASLLGLSANGCMPIYSSTKAAVISLTRCFATEIHYGFNGIRFMAVCPNATMTNLFEGLEKHFLIPEKDFLLEFQRVTAEIPFQSPENVARCVVNAVQSGENGSIWVPEYDRPAKQVFIEDLPLNGLDKTADSVTASRKV